MKKIDNQSGQEEQISHTYWFINNRDKKTKFHCMLSMQANTIPKSIDFKKIRFDKEHLFKSYILDLNYYSINNSSFTVLSFICIYQNFQVPSIKKKELKLL